MSKDAVSITHAEALRLIDEQVGERVYLALFVKRAESESGEEGPMPFIQKDGRLGNPFGTGHRDSKTTSASTASVARALMHSRSHR